jgi:hypothetical protein
LEALDRPDIGQIAPYVEKVNFVPPIQSWAIGRELFETIVIHQAIEDQNERECMDWIYQHGDKASQEHIIKDIWHGKPPFSEDELEEGFNIHRRVAEAIQETFNSGRLAEAWTKALQTFSALQTIRVTGLKDVRTAKTEIPSCCAIKRHKHNYTGWSSSHHQDTACQEAYAPIGNALFATVIKSLVDGEIAIRNLELSGELNIDGLDFESLPRWDELNLTRLLELRFEPITVSLPDDINDDVNNDFVGKAVSMLTSKSQVSLNNLFLEGYGGWPAKDTAPLPKLEVLELQMAIRPVPFTTCLSTMKNLKSLTLRDCHLYSYTANRYADWRIVMDAIRNHPNDIQLEFEQIITNSAAEMSLIHNTGSDCRKLLWGLKADEEYTQDEAWTDAERCMCLYMSGKIGWNKSLRVWFEDE